MSGPAQRATSERPQSEAHIQQCWLHLMDFLSFRGSTRLLLILSGVEHGLLSFTKHRDVQGFDWGLDIAA